MRLFIQILSMWNLMLFFKYRKVKTRVAEESKESLGVISIQGVSCVNEDCISYVTNLMAELDSSKNMPEGLNPIFWDQLCHYRHEKVIKELMVWHCLSIYASYIIYYYYCCCCCRRRHHFYICLTITTKNSIILSINNHSQFMYDRGNNAFSLLFSLKMKLHRSSPCRVVSHHCSQ